MHLFRKNMFLNKTGKLKLHPMFSKPGIVLGCVEQVMLSTF